MRHEWVSVFIPTKLHLQKQVIDQIAAGSHVFWPLSYSTLSTWFFRKFPFILPIISGALDPNCLYKGLLHPPFNHLTGMYRLLTKKYLWIPECLLCSIILWSFVVISIAHPFFLANISGFLLWMAPVLPKFQIMEIFSSFQKKLLWAEDMRWPPFHRKPYDLLRMRIILRGLGTCDGFSRRKLMKLSTFYTKTVVRMFFQKSQVLTVCLLWSFQLFNSKGALPPGGKNIEGVRWSPGEYTEKPIYVAWTVLP